MLLCEKAKDNRDNFDVVKVVKLEELLDGMKVTKGNIPSPGEYVILEAREKNVSMVDCSMAFKWLKNAEIDFNPQGDIQQLQDLNQFMAAKCLYTHLLSIHIVLSLSIAGTIFRSKGHSLLKLAEFIEVIP